MEQGDAGAGGVDHGATAPAGTAGDRALDAGPPVLRGLVLGDGPAPWRALGFDPVGDRLHLGGVTLHLTGAGGGLLGWWFDRPVGTLDGLPDAAAEPAPAAAPGGLATSDVPAARHAAGPVVVDHVVAATADHERTAAALAGVGLATRRTVDAARGDAGTRYAFTLLGTCLLEVIGPREPAGADPARLVGLALAAPDLDAFAEVATGPPRAAVQPGRRIVTVRREVGLGVPLAVLTPR